MSWSFTRSALSSVAFVCAVGCGSAGHPAEVTIVSTLQKPAEIPLPSPKVAEDARVKSLLDEASAALKRGDRPRASAAALAIVCGKEAVTAKELAACPPPRSADVSSGWALVGELAFEGTLTLGRVAVPAREPSDAGPLSPSTTFTFDELEVNGALPDQLPLAAFAFERALRVSPSRTSRASVLYKLGWVRYRLDEFDRAIDAFLQTLDEVRTNPTHDEIDLRDEALEYAAISIAETDWDDDGRDDPVRGFDRPEVQARLKNDTPEMPDLYARVIAVLLDQSECVDATSALGAMTSRFPKHPKLPELTQSVARLCP